MVKRTKLPLGDRFFVIANYAFLTIWLLVIIYPLIYIVSASLSDPFAVKSGRVLLYPVEPTLRAYRAVFQYPDVGIGYFNSFFYAIVGTAINLFVTVIAAYPLSRKDFYGHKAITGIFVFTMLFSGGLIPFFLVVRNLGMYNTRMALLIPGALSVWNMILARTYFRVNIPDELYEATVIDGGSDIRFIRSVVLPLSGPILAVVGLFYAVGHWNSFFGALIFLKRKNLFPLQIFLRNILLLNQVDLDRVQDIEEMMMKQDLVDLLKYALIIVASVPILLIYPFAQRYFVKGVLLGSLKG